MKKTVKVTLLILVLLIVCVAILAIYVKKGLPNVGPPPDLKVFITAERVDHGRYLATHVAVCIICHSSRDYTHFGAPIKEGTLGAGGELFGKGEGFPGSIYAYNITPYHLGQWTDGELFRAITAGETRDGHGLFPIMNYPAYGKADTSDIISIIAYLRTLPAVPSETPERTLDFPVNFIVNTMPAKATPSPRPDTNDAVAYGRYLVSMASCIVCHSKADKGAVVPGTEFGGGRDFPMEGVVRYSANISPDKETGIGYWNQALFVRKFKQYADSGYSPPPVKPEGVTPMPWLAYAGMRERDLSAIFAYLQTVKPIHNKVKK
jgi:mono/diheme cytochrome c family protein